VSGSDVTKAGLRDARPGREAAPSGTLERPRRRGRGEQPMVPDASFSSYYGKLVLNQPTWEARDIAGYLFLGGLAGAGSVIAAGAHLTRRPGLARALKCGAAAAGGLSLAALVHDLGRPLRFLNMLRTIKPTSPMSIGSWLLAGYMPAAAAAAASDLTGRMPRAAAAAAAAGPAVATYTAALIADTAVPAWHDGHRHLPFLFAASAVTAAAGLGLAAAPRAENEPVRRLGVAAGSAELIIESLMKHQMGMVAGAYEEGRAKQLGQAARALAVSGVLTAGLAGHRSRPAAAAAGAALLAASALTRFAIFDAGLNSAADPRYTVIPQRLRQRQRLANADGGAAGASHPGRAASSCSPAPY